MAEGRSRTSGWVGIGCGCLLVVLVGLIALGVMLKGRLEDFLENEVAEFVSDEPVELAEMEVDSETIDSVIVRFDNFRRSVTEAAGAPARLELSSRDINILIAHYPEFSAAADKVRVKLEEETIAAQVSFPLGDIVPVVGGGFVNGQARFSLRVEEKVPVLFLEKLEVNGKALPQAIMAELKSEIILEESEDVFGKVRSIVVHDGKLIIEAGGP